MIEETGRVVRVSDEYVWVETDPVTACGSCTVRSGCGTPVLARVLGRRNAPLRVANTVAAAVGDHVVLGISESGLVRGSLAVYLVPLAGLFAGALCSYFLAQGLLANYTEPASILGAVAGLSAGLAWLGHFSRAAARDHRYQPVILRHAIAARPKAPAAMISSA
jgi:sigma-E factor negative regulatory protein RseC